MRKRSEEKASAKEQPINLRRSKCYKFYYNSFEMENVPPACNQAQVPQQCRFEFSQPREPLIFFDSRFDSGNLSRVVRNSHEHYSLWTACDAQGTDNEGYPKSWFYFAVGGFSNRRLTFSIHRLHFLYAMIKHNEQYRPVYRIKYENGEISDWERLPYPVLGLCLNQEQQLVLKFDFMFSKVILQVEFAFIYPYSYEQCRKDAQQLETQYCQDKELFFGRYQLTKSYEGRSIDMLMISSHEGKEGFQCTKGLPFSDQKLVRFRSNKPIIFISARVHPIETPSSYCMNGVLRFLLDKNDMRAFLLRRYFVFVLVPMLNPDGVARGHCRMDALNQNLNRYYSSPDPEKQPSCFAVKKLCELYSKEKRLFMYLDLHAHPAHKGNFIFGNAIYEFIEQVESQLYPKVLSQNCINFEFQQCIFSRKHMKAKDRNEDISKEGCARVVFYKELGIVHSYTLECGYHLNSYDNPLLPEKNASARYLIKYRLNEKAEKIYDSGEKLFEQEGKLQTYLQEMRLKQSNNWEILGLVRDKLDDKEDQYYKREWQLYTPQTFHNLGRSIVVSILDIWNKNPFTRTVDMNCDRKQIADRQAKLDRFRKEQAGIKNKQKRIVELIEEQLYGEWHKRNVMNPNNNATVHKDKRRNHTLQLQKQPLFRPPRSEKSEKPNLLKEEPKEPINSDIIADSDKIQQPLKTATLAQLHRQEKTPSSDLQADNRLYYSKNFKLNRGKQTNSANQGQGCRPPSINKEVMATQIKITLEDELMKAHRQDALSLSSKLIKNPGFGFNMRVRNVAMGGFGGGMVPLRR